MAVWWWVALLISPERVVHVGEEEKKGARERKVRKGGRWWERKGQGKRKIDEGRYWKPRESIVYNFLSPPEGCSDGHVKAILHHASQITQKEAARITDCAVYILPVVPMMTLHNVR